MMLLACELMNFCGCYVGSAEIPHPWSKFPRVGSLPVHTSEPHHRGEPRPSAADRPSINNHLSATDTICHCPSTELPHVQGDGTLAQFRRCLDQEPVSLSHLSINQSIY